MRLWRRLYFFMRQRGSGEDEGELRTCSKAADLDNINKNGARTAGAKVAPFLFMLRGLWVLELTFAIAGAWDRI